MAPKPFPDLIQKNDIWICSLCQFFAVMSCHIGSGMPNLCKFDEDFVALLGEMAKKNGCKNSSVVRIREQAMSQTNFQQQKKKKKKKKKETQNLWLANF